MGDMQLDNSLVRALEPVVIRFEREGQSVLAMRCETLIAGGCPAAPAHAARRPPVVHFVVVVTPTNEPEIVFVDYCALQILEAFVYLDVKWVRHMRHFLSSE